MILTLPKGSSFWGFGPLWIQFNNLPFEVDLNDLDKQTRDMVVHALLTGELVEVKTEIQRQQVEQQSAVYKQPKVKQESISDEDKKTVVDFLKNGITSIRKEIINLSNTNLLEYMLKTEQKSKKRKKVIDIIKERISEVKSATALVTMRYDDNIIDDGGDAVTKDIEAVMNDIAP